LENEKDKIFRIGYTIVEENKYRCALESTIFLIGKAFFLTENVAKEEE